MRCYSGMSVIAASVVALITFGIATPALAAAPVDKGEIASPTIGPGSNFTHEAYVEGVRDAPGLLARAGVACTVEQAVYEGESNLLDASGKTVGHARLYEVACAEGLGYMLNVRGKAPPVAFDCVTGGQSGKIACMLPLNSHPAGGLEPLLKAAGVSCGVVRARFLGTNTEEKLRRYEVSCGAQAGYILDTPLPDGSGPAPVATPCFQLESECRFTTHLQNVVMLAYRVGKSFGDGCRIGDARYVGYVAAHGAQLYEVSCQSGHDGELIEVDSFGALKSSQECSRIKLVGAACQLKAGEIADPRVVQAETTGAAPPNARRSVITNPDWVRRPSGSEVDALYPALAKRSWVTGRAVIECGVMVSGLLEDCAIIDESPAGYGFGAAALKMSRSFQMRPQTRDGVPISGAQVMIPISFSMRRN